MVWISCYMREKLKVKVNVRKLENYKEVNTRKEKKLLKEWKFMASEEAT